MQGVFRISEERSQLMMQAERITMVHDPKLPFHCKLKLDWLPALSTESLEQNFPM
jgi:hypothetical protein